MLGNGFPSRPTQVNSRFICPHCFQPFSLPTGFTQQPGIQTSLYPQLQLLGVPHTSFNQYPAPRRQSSGVPHTSLNQYPGPRPHFESSSEPYTSRPTRESSSAQPIENDSKVGDWASLWSDDWSKLPKEDSTQPPARDRIQPYHQQAFQEATEHLITLYNEFVERPTSKLKGAERKEDGRSSTADEAITRLNRISSRMGLRNKVPEHKFLGDIKWEVFGEIWSDIFNPTPPSRWYRKEGWQSERKKYNEGRLKTLVERCGYPEGWASCPPYYSGPEYSMDEYL